MCYGHQGKVIVPLSRKLSSSLFTISPPSHPLRNTPEASLPGRRNGL